HDLAVVRAMAHDMIVIKDGKVVEAGASHRVFDAPQHPYTQELLAAACGLSS
ncbi:ABC transporter ATP-binding protein, partial [Pseudomonas reactans]|nr:ABC transporter ATP-binding protein [Pseudomonas reactans]